MKKLMMLLSLAIFVKLTGRSSVIEFPDAHGFHIQGEWIMVMKRDSTVAAVFNRQQVQWVSETNLD